jgi:predicted lipoprotein with Yx(FWY)xxD motif
MSARSTTLVGSHPTSRRPRRRRTFAVATGLAGAALALAACGTGSGPSSARIAPAPAGAALTTASTSLGTILVDGQGKTVYRFAADTKGHSNCDAACLQYWPALTSTVDLPTAASSVTAALGSITRSDGTKQVTVNGWPLYTYAGDNAPGATSGQGSNLSGGLWWVVSSDGGNVMSAQSTATSSGGYGY